MRSRQEYAGRRHSVALIYQRAATLREVGPGVRTRVQDRMEHLVPNYVGLVQVVFRHHDAVSGRSPHRRDIPAVEDEPGGGGAHHIPVYRRE